MNKPLLTLLLVALPVNSFAAQQQLQTRANTTSPSVDTNFTRQQAMNTDLYTNKADKSSTIVEWSTWPNGTQFVANAIVSYQGTLYKCLQPYTKNAGDSPATFSAYWSVAGGVTSYNALTDKPAIPANLADLSADSTHRVVTDAEKSAWNGKESALGVPATSDWCLKSNTSGVRAWGACGSFDASGSYSPTGTWDFTGATVTGLGTATLPSATEGQILQANSSGVYESTSSLAGLINSTCLALGTCAIDDILPASQIVTALSGKQATLGTNAYHPYTAALAGISGNSKYWGTNSSGTVGVFDLPSGGTGTFAFDTFPTYSDSPHTSGIAVNDTHVAVYSGATNGWGLVPLTFSLDAAPVTYAATLFITDASVTGDTFTLNTIPYDAADSPVSVTDLPTATEVITYTGSNLGNCSGDVTGTANTGPWTITDGAATVDCAVTVAAGVSDWYGTDVVGGTLLATDAVGILRLFKITESLPTGTVTEYVANVRASATDRKLIFALYKDNGATLDLVPNSYTFTNTTVASAYTASTDGQEMAFHPQSNFSVPSSGVYYIGMRGAAYPKVMGTVTGGDGYSTALDGGAPWPASLTKTAMTSSVLLPGKWQVKVTP